MEINQPRNVFLVIIWSYGLFVLMHIYQYIGSLIAAKTSGKSFDAIISGKFGSDKIDLIMSASAVTIGVLIAFLAARFLWGRNFEWMRLQFNGKQLLFGLVIGLILPFVILLILKLFGFAKISWEITNLQGIGLTILGYAGFAIFSGIAEEIVFRGMAAREFALQYGWITAAIIGGVFFGIAHLLTKIKNMTVVEVIWVLAACIFVSLTFVSMYVRSQSLWLPIGFHIAWNFCLKGIMGIRLSGNEASVGLFNVELSGGQIFTGGSFGIEASVVSILIYIITAIAFIKLPWNGIINLLSSK